MKLSTHFRQIRKGVLLFFVLTLLGGYCVHDALSHYTGGALVAGYAELGSCGGPSCHGFSADPTTTIHLFTPAQIIAGQTYTLTLSVSNPNPEDVAAGFDVDINPPATLAAIPGTNTILTLPDSFAYPVVWSVSHSIPQSFNVNGANSDSAVWTFQYTARPTAGIDTIYLAGNAVNGDSANANDSDRWNAIVTYITVLPPQSIVTPASSGNLLQVYPNPASNEMFINDGNPNDAGSYTLTDAAGRVVLSGGQIPLDGRHSVDISRIAAGAYILNVQPRMGQAITRSIAIQH
jgi:Secretion system C-terminal sorting domain